MGDTAFHTRTAECLIKHPEYFFGEAPPISVPEKPVTFTVKSTPTKPLSLDITQDTSGGDDVDFDTPQRPLSINSEDSVNGKRQYNFSVTLSMPC